MTRQEFDALTERERRGVATAEELAALEPYRMRRAVIMAAGFGSRLAPLTLTTPKPLVKVHGVRIIDTLLDALLAAGIEEIYIVRGYLAERFEELREKYPTVRFLDNPFYDGTSSISSILQAVDHMENAYICEADMLISNPGIITKYQYESNILGAPAELTDDWYLGTDESGAVTELKKGGANGYRMFVITAWTAEDAGKLREDIPAVFATEEGRNEFFEAIPLTLCRDRYTVRVRACDFSDIVEIDTLDELKAIDPSYASITAGTVSLD